MGKPASSSPILLVEDSDDDYKFTMRAFEKAKLANPITRAVDGEEAISYLDNVEGPKFPSLILLDLNLPKIDGFKVLEHIKKSESLRKIPVIVLTTSDRPEDVSRCYELGANSYVVKPVDIAGLLEAVQRIKNYWFEVVLHPE